jgi:alpha-tubulin suppressor-like RCC1 family protein
VTFMLQPLQIQSLAAHGVRATAAAAGRQHSLVLGHDGRVWAFGDGSRGQLGLGPARREQVATPAALEGLPAAAASVYAGGDASAAVGADGELWVWGRGEGGVLGTGDEEDRAGPSQIGDLEGCRVDGLSLGSAHCLLLVRRPAAAADPLAHAPAAAAAAAVGTVPSEAGRS